MSAFEQKPGESDVDWLTELSAASAMAFKDVIRVHEENALLKRVLKQLILAAPNETLVVDLSKAEAAKNDKRHILMGGGQIILEEVPGHGG